MIILMNSAMMPSDGVYCKKTVSASEFARAFHARIVQGASWISRIGYAENCQILSQLLGVTVDFSRDETTVAPGDLMFVCKLKFRVAPMSKGEARGLTLDMLEFSIITYSPE